MVLILAPRSGSARLKSGPSHQIFWNHIFWFHFFFKFVFKFFSVNFSPLHGFSRWVLDLHWRMHVAQANANTYPFKSHRHWLWCLNQYKKKQKKAADTLVAIYIFNDNSTVKLCINQCVSKHKEKYKKRPLNGPT